MAPTNTDGAEESRCKHCDRRVVRWREVCVHCSVDGYDTDSETPTVYDDHLGRFVIGMIIVIIVALLGTLLHAIVTGVIPLTPLVVLGLLAILCYLIGTAVSRIATHHEPD